MISSAGTPQYPNPGSAAPVHHGYTPPSQQPPPSQQQQQQQQPSHLQQQQQIWHNQNVFVLYKRLFFCILIIF